MTSSSYIPNLQVNQLNIGPTAQLKVDANNNIMAVDSVTNNVQSFNPVSQSSVTLNTGDSVPGLVFTTGNFGCYMIFVYGSEGNACAQFMASKSRRNQTNGSIFKITSSCGATGEELDVLWPYNSPPAVYHSTVATSNATDVTYNVQYIGGNGGVQTETS